MTPIDPDGKAKVPVSGDTPVGSAGTAEREPLDWLTTADLVARGVAVETIDRLPHTHFGAAGHPCWSADEIDDISALAERGAL